MPQTEKKRIAPVYCPICEMPTLWWGNKKKEGMVRCMVKEHTTAYPVEKCLKIKETRWYRAAYMDGYNEALYDYGILVR